MEKYQDLFASASTADDHIEEIKEHIWDAYYDIRADKLILEKGVCFTGIKEY